MSEHWRVPFLDLHAGYAELSSEIDAAIRRVLDSGWYVLGEELTAFESEFAAYSGSGHCVGVGNGLDALVLALLALGVGPGDEVIVPSNTYIATWLAVSEVGALPVAVEPDPGTHNMAPDLIGERITERTRAILPVHLYGQPADMASVVDVARSHGLPIVADAAQAHGALLGGAPIGAVGDVVCWSFYPGKNLGGYGDGGAITTDDPDVAARVRVLRNYGSRVKYVNEVKGRNSRLDELQAAVLRVKLPLLDEWNERRCAIAGRYCAALADLDQVVLPLQLSESRSAWHLFVVRHARRDDLQVHLSGAGVQTLIHYPIPPHRQAAYAEMAHRALPVAEQLASEVLSLPIGPHLSDQQVDMVIDAVRGSHLSLGLR